MFEQLILPSAVAVDGNSDFFKPPPIIDSGVRTIGGLRNLARRMWGCEYVPRNNVLIVPSRQFDDPTHSAYKEYLRRPTFKDSFGARHDARREWQSEQSRHIDTQLFDRDFVNNNQMTGNAISSVILQTEILADIVYAGIPGLSDNLRLIADRMFAIYADDTSYTSDAQERYRRLSFERKLSVVHDISNLIACALWDIAWYTDPQPQPVKVWTTGNFRRSNSMEPLDRRYYSAVPLLA